MARKASAKPADSTATIGFEAKLWLAAEKGKAKFAWVQHFIHHLAPQTALIDSAPLRNEASPQVVSEAKNNMVALPGQLFYCTQISVCLWFLAKNKAADAKRSFRNRRKQTLFIDARKLGTLIDRVHRELTDAAYSDRRLRHSFQNK